MENRFAILESPNREAITENPFLITENSPQVLQPDSIKLKLKPHQLASIYKIIELDSTCKLNCGNGEYNITSNVGILGDYPGSGKTITMLSAISMLKGIETTQLPNTRSFSRLSFGITITNELETEFTNTTLIVIPNNLVDHWESHLKKTDLTYEIVTESEIDKIEFSGYDVVICPARFYNKLIITEPEYRWNRVVIDEADSIPIPRMLKPNARFLWLITSTYLNIARKKNKGFLKDVFSCVEIIKRYFYAVVIHCNPDFVKKSFSLKSPIVTQIKCTVENYISAIYPFLSEKVAECINAGNIEQAIFELGGTIDSLENIITLLIKDINNKIVKSRANLKTIEKLELSPEDKQSQITKLNEKLASLETRKSSIITSIKNHANGTCTICLGNLKVPTVTNCCATVFCGECLLLWAKTSNKCPICRETLIPTELKTIGDKIYEVTTPQLTKMDALLNLLDKYPEGRFLIFVDSAIFSTVGDFLKENNKKYGILTAMRIGPTIQKFRNREINIILLSPQHNGAGIEIPEATDVILFHSLDPQLELQTIGRAQRPQRLGVLNVWKLMYSWEF